MENSKKLSNEELLPVIAQINDLEEVSSEELLLVTETITNNINLSKLKRSIITACKHLSLVGKPNLKADVERIAMDNQERLELIYSLLNAYETIELDVKNFKRNRLNCRENTDYLVNLVMNTQKALEAVQEYGDFRIQEHIENEKYIRRLQENEKKLLNKGEE